MAEPDLSLLQRRIAELQNAGSTAAKPGIAGGGGGPHDPGMDARLKVVELGVADLRAVLSRIEPVLARLDDRSRKAEGETLPKLAVDVAELKGRVSQLPTTTAIFSYMGSLVTLVLAIGGVAFVVIRAAFAH